MKTATVYWLVALAVLIIILLGKPSQKAGYSNEKNTLLRAEISQASEDYAKKIPQALLLNQEQHGNALSLRTGEVISSEQIQSWLDNSKKTQQQLAYSMRWLDDTRRQFTESSMGVDRKHYIANSFLVGITPFATENPWLPLYTLANRKTYQLDSEQYQGADVWQNSAQAFANLRGDCEDHAIVLADWLISMGIDARVVLGRYKQGGHAWVVAFMEEEAYILEATSKREVQNWKHYPLASVASHYFPSAMFNRKSFWLKRGSAHAKDYSDSAWEEVSHFEKQKTGDNQS